MLGLSWVATMISSGLSADLNSRVIPARGRPSPLGAATAGPGRARRILTPTTGHETRTRAKTGERREAQVRFSLVKPPVGRGANQKPEEPLCNTRLATPLQSCLRFFLFSPSRVHCHPPRWTVVPRGGSRPPFAFFLPLLPPLLLLRRRPLRFFVPWRDGESWSPLPERAVDDRRFPPRTFLRSCPGKREFSTLPRVENTLGRCTLGLRI